nr:immunoglobulin heavy chain junction region [Mus musculus]
CARHYGISYFDVW